MSGSSQETARRAVSQPYAYAVQDLFGVPLRDLDATVVAAGLRNAETESLLWEAKGGAVLPKPKTVRRQCGGFANSNEGGYLILGASEPDGKGSSWTIDGIPFPDDEPERWITSCLQEDIRPAPAYDVQSFRIGADRHLLVVRIEPLRSGPCIVGGSVFERVPGATIAVTEPTRLAELFARGERAHERARRSVERVLGETRQALPGGPSPDAHLRDLDAERAQFIYLTLAIAPVAPASNISSRLFRASTGEHCVSLVRSLAGQDSSHASYRVEVTESIAQDRRTVSAQTYQHYYPDWAVIASWSGSVGVAYRGIYSYPRPGILISDVVRPAFETALNLTSLIADSRIGYVRISLFDHGEAWPIGATLRRGPIDLRPDALDMDSLEREINRTLGNEAPEPE